MLEIAGQSRTAPKLITASGNINSIGSSSRGHGLPLENNLLRIIIPTMSQHTSPPYLTTEAGRQWLRSGS